jgi:hypothetical protein
MKLKINANGKIINCPAYSWARIVEQGNEHKFTVLETDSDVKPVARKNSTTVEPVDLAAMPEVDEANKAKRGRKPKDKDETPTKPEDE